MRQGGVLDAGQRHFPSLPAGLAYCRHLSTVRTHLSALVNHMIVSPDLPCDAGHGLTAGIWEQYLQDSTVRRGQRLWGDRDYGDLLSFFKE